MTRQSPKTVLILAIAAGAAVLWTMASLAPATKASDEDWTDRASERCEAKQGYLVYLHKANAPTEEVLCLPVIFREKAP